MMGLCLGYSDWPKLGGGLERVTWAGQEAQLISSTANPDQVSAKGMGTCKTSACLIYSNKITSEQVKNSQI